MLVWEWAAHQLPASLLWGDISLTSQHMTFPCPWSHLPPPEKSQVTCEPHLKCPFSSEDITPQRTSLPGPWQGQPVCKACYKALWGRGRSRDQSPSWLPWAVLETSKDCPTFNVFSFPPPSPLLLPLLHEMAQDPSGPSEVLILFYYLWFPFYPYASLPFPPRRQP